MFKPISDVAIATVFGFVTTIGAIGFMIER
jgi:hypothetical protein